MNIFKREITIFLRSRLFQLFFPISVIIFSIWLFLGLKIFELNNLDIVSIYNVVPIIFTLLIPLLSYSFWQKERALGLDYIILNKSMPVKLIILYKALSLILIFSSMLLLFLPIIILLSGTGFIDIGQVFSINLGLLLFISYAVTLTMLLSVLIKSRVLNIIIGIFLLFITGYGNQILLTFYSGLIELKNLLSPLLLCLVFLILILSILDRKAHFKESIIVIPLLVLSLFIPGSLDLTTLKSHTITEYSKDIIQNADSNFEIDYYYSEDLLLTSKIPNDTIHLLNQFKQLNNINVKVTTDRDNTFFEAVRIYQPSSISDDQLFNFMVIKYKNYTKIIPFIPYVETLEFEILKVINFYLNNGLKTIGIYIGNEEFTEDNFTALNSALSDHFTTLLLFPGDPIPDDLDALFVIGHFGINSTYTWEIGHYLSHGGNLIVAGTGLPTGENLTYRNTPILEALISNGVQIEPYIISEPGNSQDYELNIITYPNRELQGNSIILPFTGFIGIYTSPVLIRSGNFVNLLYTSRQAWLVDSTTGLEGVPESDYPVAVYGEGNFSEGFTGEKSNAKNRLLVIGNSISFSDYIVELGGDNSYDFIVRSLYTMVGYEDLMNIRHKYNWEKTLIKVERDIYRGSQLSILKVFILYIYPFLILITTTVIRKKSY